MDKVNAFRQVLIHETWKGKIPIQLVSLRNLLHHKINIGFRNWRKIFHCESSKYLLWLINEFTGYCIEELKAAGASAMTSDYQIEIPEIECSELTVGSWETAK